VNESGSEIIMNQTKPLILVGNLIIQCRKIVVINRRKTERDKWHRIGLKLLDHKNLSAHREYLKINEIFVNFLKLIMKNVSSGQ